MAQLSGKFGVSVALSGNTALIGAQGETTTPAPFRSSGVVYVYTGSEADWTQQARFFATDAVNADRFGVSVALTGNIALVGAFNKGGGDGAAYVFTRSGDMWSQQAKLGDDINTGDNFGISVALSASASSSVFAVIGSPGRDFTINSRPLQQGGLANIFRIRE